MTTDTNQASEDELDNILDNIFWLGYKFAIDKLDKTPNEYLAETIEAIAAIIRTEKLKLLDRLSSHQEDLFWWTGGEYEKTKAVDMRAIAAEREQLSKLEAEL